MTRLTFANGRIAAAGGTPDAAAITVADGRIAAFAAGATDGSEGDGPEGDRPDGDGAIDLAGGWLLPGFIDTQVNGGGGVLFNDDPSVAAIAAIGACHAAFGTTAFLPTLISETPQQIARALDAGDAAIRAGVPGVIGVHIEGPVLNPARRGIHDPALFRTLDDELLTMLTRPRAGKVMVTLAPEQTDPAAIAALVAAGVVVSAGHSEAPYRVARAAFDAGLSGITHLFNAMPPMVQRDPGLVGAALDDPRPWCGLIVDRVHVDPAVLRVALGARGTERMMLVTDAMSSVGMRDKDFTFQGHRVTVRGGVCSFADGTLAGSDLDMASAVANAVADLAVDVPTASRMASANPAAFLGLAGERGTIAPGQRADLVQLDAALGVVATWIGGVRTA